MTISAIPLAGAPKGAIVRDPAPGHLRLQATAAKGDGPAWPAVGLLGAGTVAALGAFAVNGHVAARLGVGAIGVAAAVMGARMLHNRGTQEYVVTLSTDPDYSSTASMPDGPERRQAVSDIAKRHFATEGATIQSELAQLQDDGVVDSFSGHPFANDFTVQVRRHDHAAFESALRADPHVGTVETASLG